MRTLAITQNITVDGSIEMLGDWFDPGDQDPEVVEAQRLQAEQEDAMLLGRQTFEDFRLLAPPGRRPDGDHRRARRGPEVRRLLDHDRPVRSGRTPP